MQAVILAAGEGVRMRPLTYERPKPLVMVAGMPILEHVVRALPDAVDEIVLVVKYRSDQIRAVCGETFLGKRIRYVEQGEQKGTAAALRYARPLLQNNFLVTFADDLLSKADLEQLIGHEYALLVCEHEQPERFGVVTLNKDGTLSTIIEKPEHPETNLISTGVAVLTQKIFEYEPEGKNGELFLTGMINGLAKDYPVVTVKASVWQPIGYPEHIPIAEKLLSEIVR
jgi:bifunctional UDP-N-acetylglucosamine pyrophosphorylase/glucosamine-1-phosphate N-acetyltransferase